jgi:hypothetical protein
MRHIWTLSITILLGVAFTFPAGAQQPLPSGGADGPCASAEEPTLSLPVTAIVSTINLRRGRATLETSVGKLELAAAPAELRALQTGDVLTLCVDPAELPGTDTTAPSPLG